MEVNFVVVLDVEIDNIPVGEYVHILTETDTEYSGFWYNNCGAYSITLSKSDCHKIDKDPETIWARGLQC